MGNLPWQLRYKNRKWISIWSPQIPSIRSQALPVPLPMEGESVICTSQRTKEPGSRSTNGVRSSGSRNRRYQLFMRLSPQQRLNSRSLCQWRSLHQLEPYARNKLTSKSVCSVATSGNPRILPIPWDNNYNNHTFTQVWKLNGVQDINVNAKIMWNWKVEECSTLLNSDISRLYYIHPKQASGTIWKQREQLLLRSSRHSTSISLLNPNNTLHQQNTKGRPSHNKSENC